MQENIAPRREKWQRLWNLVHVLFYNLDKFYPKGDIFHLMPDIHPYLRALDFFYVNGQKNIIAVMLSEPGFVSCADFPSIAIE